MNQPIQRSSDRNSMPERGFCARRGNLNAPEEIVEREKKFQRLRQKGCTL
jgi:hypothetical protein